MTAPPHGSRFISSATGILFFTNTALAIIHLIVLIVWIGHEGWPHNWELSFSVITSINVFPQLLSNGCNIYWYNENCKNRKCYRPIRSLFFGYAIFSGIFSLLYLTSGVALAYRANQWNTSEFVCSAQNCKLVMLASAISFLMFIDFVASTILGVKHWKSPHEQL